MKQSVIEELYLQGNYERNNLHFSMILFFFFFFLNLFIFWLCWVFVSVRGLSLVAASGGPLFIAVRGPLTVAASLVAEAQAPDTQAQ